jgi:hypothetical protein
MMLKHRRYDVRSMRLAGFRIEIYWRSDDLGDGPCMSIYVGGREIVRFDLFDPAHKHLRRQPYQPRIYYPEGLSRIEYIRLALADLVKLYPQARRAMGWAEEQLLAVQRPAPKMSLEMAAR